ncbi:MAG: glycosyltransferase [Lachnospiraceae bacterium]|nr:glycosyltransferase [Lachnospiraceae bacterium]
MNQKVSIILTNYNKASFVGKAIESILNQTYDDFELIIVDDGSSDNSMEILKKYAQTDARIKLFSFETNKGIPSAHNYGIENASGEYCAMIDCDDFWEKDKLEKQIVFLEEHLDYGACFSWINIIDENDQQVASEECEFRDVMWNSANHTQGEWLRIFFTEGCKLSNSSMVIRKNVLQQVGLYSYGLKQLQDYDLFVRILKQCNVYVIPEKLVNYRWFMGKIKNTSVDNIETSNRTNYEYYLICQSFFYGMDKEVFLQGFEQLFEHEKRAFHNLKCEQIFIYKNYFLNKEIGYAVSMELLFQLLNDAEYRKILGENYLINSSYFADGLKQPIFYSSKYYMDKMGDQYIAQKDKECEEVKQAWHNTKEYVTELEDKIIVVNNELKKSREYITELEQKVKESFGFYNESKVYIASLEDNVKELDSEIRNAKGYIAELEGKIKESYSLYGKAQDYIGELEERVKEGFGLYNKSMEYANLLENRVRELENNKEEE